MVEPTDSQKSKFQIDALDGLRGLAALIVVFSHTSNRGMFFLPGLNLRNTGQVGVFLFFILSAYLLTRPMLARPSKSFSRPNLLSYGWRRVLRIFPLYIVFLGVAFLATAYPIVIDGKQTYLPFRLDWTGLMEHLLLQRGQSVAWSIPVEFKYYFVLPIIAFLIVKLADTKFFRSALLLSVIFLFACAIRTLTGEGFVRIHTIYYIEAFLFGTLAAVFKNGYDLGEFRSASKLIPFLALIGGAGLVVTMPSVLSLIIGQEIQPDFYKARVFMSGLFWLPILLLLICEGGTLFERMMASPAMRFLGKISFSLYLVHISVLNLVPAFQLNSLLSAWLVLFVSIAVSYLTYALIERPFSRMRI